MTRSEFAGLLELARKDEYLFPPRLIEEFDLTAPPATPEEISGAEQKLGVRLPPDYVFFLQTYGGGQFGYVDIATVEANSNRNIFWDQPAIEGERNFVAISANGCGDYYGFEVRNGICQPQLMFWDHELGGEITPTEFNDLFEFVAIHGFMSPFDRHENGLL